MSDLEYEKLEAVMLKLNTQKVFKHIEEQLEKLEGLVIFSQRPFSLSKNPKF